MESRLSNAVASLAAALAEKEEELRAREAAVAAGERHIGVRFCWAASEHIKHLQKEGTQAREELLDQHAAILDCREAELAARESAWATEQSDASCFSRQGGAGSARKLKDVWCAACKRRVPYSEYFFCFLCDSGGCCCSLAPTQGHWRCAGCEQDACDHLLTDWYSSAAEVPQSSVQAPAMMQRMDTPPTPPPPPPPLSSTLSSASAPLAQGRRAKAPPPPPPAQSLPPTPLRPMSLAPAHGQPQLAEPFFQDMPLRPHKMGPLEEV
jgi:hypothetical protein